MDELNLLHLIYRSLSERCDKDNYTLPIFEVSRSRSKRSKNKTTEHCCQVVLLKSIQID